MAKKTDKDQTIEDLKKKIQQMKHIITQKNALNASNVFRIANYQQTIEELEERADDAWKESEEIIRMLKDAADNAENHFNQFIKNTGEFTVSDAVYFIQLLHRTAQHFYDPKTNKDEE